MSYFGRVCTFLLLFGSLQNLTLCRRQLSFLQHEANKQTVTLMLKCMVWSDRVSKIIFRRCRPWCLRERVLVLKTKVDVLPFLPFPSCPSDLLSVIRRTPSECSPTEKIASALAKVLVLTPHIHLTRPHTTHKRTKYRLPLHFNILYTHIE